jgi:hypothetical protein
MNAMFHRVAESFFLGSSERTQRSSALILLSLSCLLALPAMAAEQEEAKDASKVEVPKKELDETGEFDAHGANIVRVEQEDKITVPPEHADEVWNFLKNYLANDSETLKKLDPKFTSYWNEELFTDTYFDTPSLQVHQKRGGVRHRRREVLSNPNDVKNGRQLMQIKLNDLSNNPLERGEIKFDIEHPTQIRTAEDAHPMLGIVKPGHRNDFKERLVSFGLDPYAMRPILTVVDVRRRIYVRRNNEPFLSVSFDDASSSVLWAKWHLYEIEPEINEIPFTEGDADTRAYMEKINNQIIGNLMTQFPYLKRELTPKYCKAFNAFEAQIPMYRSLIKMKLDNAESMYLSGTLGVAALVGVVIFVKRRSRGKQTA